MSMSESVVVVLLVLVLLPVGQLVQPPKVGGIAPACHNLLM